MERRGVAGERGEKLLYSVQFHRLILFILR